MANDTQAALMQLAGSAEPQKPFAASASSSGLMAPISSSSTRPADGTVQDLGIVGRGSKRIKLAPAPLTGGPLVAGHSSVMLHELGTPRIRQRRSVSARKHKLSLLQVWKLADRPPQPYQSNLCQMTSLRALSS